MKKLSAYVGLTVLILIHAHTIYKETILLIQIDQEEFALFALQLYYVAFLFTPFVALFIVLGTIKEMLN